jgi:hypothetical protein
MLHKIQTLATDRVAFRYESPNPERGQRV